MSKSLGNFYTLRDVLAKGYSGREVRYALMRVHYRASLNFTWEGMEESRQALGRIDDWLARLREKAGSGSAKPSTSPPEKFEEGLDDDLNISAALGFLFEKIRETNRALDLGNLNADSATSWLNWWARINSVLGLEEYALYASRGIFTVQGADAQMTHLPVTQLPVEIAQLAEARVQARLAKDWRKSDELRDELAAQGWEVRDTKDGQRITRRAGV
jgi:cysteinyl-tRNA synthetase